MGLASDKTQGIIPSAYMGVVTVQYQGIRLFIVPEGGPSFEQ